MMSDEGYSSEETGTPYDSMQADAPDTERYQKDDDAFTALKAVSALVDRLYKASGTQRYPAQSCADLTLHVPTAKDGEFYIDPNGGHWRDSFPVHCQLGTLSTVIQPMMESPRPVSKSHITDLGGIFWYAEASYKRDDADLPYQISKDQLAYLQLSSETATQKLVINCRYYDPMDRAILLGDNNLPIAMNGTDSVLVVIDVLQNTCSSRSHNGEMVILIRSQDASMLPIRDVLLPSMSSETAHVGVQPGAVIFSGAIEKSPIGMEQLYGAEGSKFNAFKR